MTEYNNISELNFKYTCRVCLKTGEDVYTMTPNEINTYKSFVVKAQNVVTDFHICILCGHLLKKYAKFVKQCQDANDILNEVFEQELKRPVISSLLTSNHNMTTTKPETHYLGPENNLDEADVDWEDSVFEKNDSLTNDDDIPLVFLSANDKRIELYVEENGRKKKRRKSSKSGSLGKENGADIEIKSEDIKKELDVDMSEICPKPAKNKKIIREGFSSRMVQETDEYLVIKLTKEQVLQEMLEKSKSEKYQRALYKCEKCVKGFNFEDVLRSHMVKHSMEHGSLHCDICTQYCPSAVSLRGHVKSHTTRYKCKVCGDVRLSRQHLLEHYAITHTPNATTYTCDHCCFTTNKRTMIQRHVKTHQPGESHACDKCGKLFKNMESLRVHTMRHDTTRRLQCEQCNRKFIYPSLLHKHVQSVHVHKDYYCVECDVKFKSADNLRLHFKKAKKHRDPSSFKHYCPQCGQRFVSTSTLSVHLSTSHGAPKQHSCALCRRLYCSRDALRAHVRRVHTEKERVRPVCHICKRSFTQKSVLTKHLRTHTGERPYACACGAAFAQRATLRTHQATKHHQKPDQQVSTDGLARGVPLEG